MDDGLHNPPEGVLFTIGRKISAILKAFGVCLLLCGVVRPAVAQDAGVVAMRVDEFKSDASVAVTKVTGRPVVEVLKREIEKAMEADGAFRIEATGQASLNGTIREITLEDIRLNDAGKVIQKRVKIRLDFAALDEATGREAVRRINFTKELEYTAVRFKSIEKA